MIGFVESIITLTEKMKPAIPSFDD